MPYTRNPIARINGMVSLISTLTYTPIMAKTKFWLQFMLMCQGVYVASHMFFKLSKRSHM